MKTVEQSGHRKRRLFGAWVVAGAMVLGASVESNAINTVAPGAAAANQNTAVTPRIPGAGYSAGIADIVKLAEAKVEPEVIKTFIGNSPVAYNPSATEIIALKDRGVAPEILTAMLQRGTEVRAQALRAGPAAAAATAPPSGSGAVNQYAPAYTASAQPIYASYAYPSHSYAYPAYDYGYYGYGWGWPYYWPSLSFSFGSYPYRGYGSYPYWSAGYRYPYWSSGYGGGRYYGHGGHYGRGGYYGHGGGGRR